MKHPVRAGLERQPHMEEPAGAVPAVDDRLCERQLLFQGTCVRKGRIGRRKTAGPGVLRTSLVTSCRMPTSDHRLDHRSHGLGVVDVDHVVQRTRRSGPDLLQRAEIGGDPYVLRVSCSISGIVTWSSQGSSRSPSPVFLNRLAQWWLWPLIRPGITIIPLQVDGFVGAVTWPRRQVLHRADAANAVALDADPAVADYVAIPVDGDDVTVFQEQRRHAARTPACCRDAARLSRSA